MTVSYVCLYPQNWWRIFRGGVRTLQGERVFQRPTPTPILIRGGSYHRGILRHSSTGNEADGEGGWGWLGA